MEVIDFEDKENAVDEGLFDCEFTNVDEIINKAVIFTGAKTSETENGERTLIAYTDNQKRSAFFTESKKLTKIVMDPERKYPFRAVIKIVRYGEFTGFRFFSPKNKITEEDRSNFNFYQKNKWRRKK